MKTKSLTDYASIIVFILAMTLLLQGCFLDGKANFPTSTPSQIDSSNTSVLINTSTATPRPTTRPTTTFAPTRTPLPPQTDLPTIHPGDIYSMINSLHSRCNFPCWGNIVPGKTSQYVAKRLLSPLGEWSEGGVPFDYGGVSFNYGNTSTTINLDFEHGLVKSILLSPTITQLYRINRLFAEYGMPEDIQIDVSPYSYDLTSHYWIILKYPRQNFLAAFFAEGTPINSLVYICPRNVSPELTLFASDINSLTQMNEIVAKEFPHKTYQPLSAFTEMDVKQFYEIFSEQGINCIATNVKFGIP
jgi:hypothetical protein